MNYIGCKDGYCYIFFLELVFFLPAAPCCACETTCERSRSGGLQGRYQDLSHQQACYLLKTQHGTTNPNHAVNSNDILKTWRPGSSNMQ